MLQGCILLSVPLLVARGSQDDGHNYGVQKRDEDPETVMDFQFFHGVFYPRKTLCLADLPITDDT